MHGFYLANWNKDHETLSTKTTLSTATMVHLSGLCQCTATPARTLFTPNFVAVCRRLDELIRNLQLD